MADIPAIFLYEHRGPVSRAAFDQLWCERAPHMLLFHLPFMMNRLVDLLYSKFQISVLLYSDIGEILIRDDSQFHKLLCFFDDTVV